jgi:hypothetical protein
MRRFAEIVTAARFGTLVACVVTFFLCAVAYPAAVWSRVGHENEAATGDPFLFHHKSIPIPKDPFSLS